MLHLAPFILNPRIRIHDQMGKVSTSHSRRLSASRQCSASLHLSRLFKPRSLYAEQLRYCHAAACCEAVLSGWESVETLTKRKEREPKIWLCTQRRDELVAELEALPEPREARSREERLASEMAGLERSVQYKTADLASAPPLTPSEGVLTRLLHLAGLERSVHYKAADVARCPLLFFQQP